MLSFARHRRQPLAWDIAGDWDNVVVFDSRMRCFVRYVDRNGEKKERVSGA